MSNAEVDAEPPGASWPVPRARSWPSTATPRSAATTTTWGYATVDGVPTFSCRAASLLAEAGRERSRALVTLVSGLGPLRGPDPVADPAGPHRPARPRPAGEAAPAAARSGTTCRSACDFVVVSHAGGEQRGCRSRRSAPPRSGSTAATSSAPSSTRTTAIERTSARWSSARPVRRRAAARCPPRRPDDPRRRARLDRPRGRPPGDAVVLPPRPQRRGAGRPPAPGAARRHLLRFAHMGVRVHRGRP